MLAVLYTWGTSGDIQLPSECWWSCSRHLRQALSSPAEGTDLSLIPELVTNDHEKVELTALRYHLWGRAGWGRGPRATYHV